ncbi:MAG: LexA family protein [Desulfomonilaceae bacterium]
MVRPAAMDIPDDPCESKRSKTDPSTEPSEFATAEIPRAGRWPGTLIEAIEAQAAIPIPAHLLRKNNIYVLRVKGDSMIGDYVLDGDHLIVERRKTAKDGEMVVALIRNSETSLNRFRRGGGKIRLEHADTSDDAMVFDEKDVAIQGIVVGILRKYKGRSSQNATGPCATIDLELV